jgi:2-polyprenyl-3-methyl-5-hydroxy-6-metoxy-1,4-benzoquinol methylase
VADAQSTPASQPPRDTSAELEKLLSTLRDRVEQRRDAGVYPPGLEAELDGHFRRLTGDRPATPSLLLDEIEQALDELDHFEYRPDVISTSSRLPGGGALHRVIAKGVGRQVQGVLDQAQDQSRRVVRILALMARATNTLAEEYDRRVVQQLDDLRTLLAREQAKLQQALDQLAEVVARVPGSGIDSWYSADTYNHHFRGSRELILDRYRDLAQLFVGCDPVLDIGFGRGEFLELLRDLGVEARGIEVGDSLVAAARERGLAAESGAAVEYLRRLPDASLGGAVMIQVIEHLSPQHVIDIVPLLAAKVRRGGRVVIETVNPMSLYVYAHAFFVDPDHVRPVHPNYLGFLFAEAGFADVGRVDRSPVDAGESMEMLPGDDPVTERLNSNFERLNALVFGPQDYAIVATR